jgi:two-component system, NtrC family, sensor kinase
MKTPMTEQSQRILVIDDNPAIHEDFRKILCGSDANRIGEATDAAFFGDELPEENHLRFTIDSAYQGRDALALMRASMADGCPYSMAFVDVRMPPGWDGIETVSRIWDLYPDLQVVICTAYSDYSWDQMTRKLGISDKLVILKKPFDNVEVLQMAHSFTAKWRLLQQVAGHIHGLERTVGERTTALRNSEEHFRLIAENAADLITVLDTDGNRLYTSPSYESFLGLSRERLRGTPASEQIHPDDQRKVLADIGASIRTCGGHVLEYRMRHRDGSWRVLESYSNPVRNAKGDVERMVIVARDITQRKQEEARRRQLEVQLRHAQKMESIGQLAAGIAHEINTPTQYIGDNTQFVQDAFRSLAPLFEAQARLVETARQGTVPPELVAEMDAAVAAADLDYLVQEIPKAIEQTLEGVQRVSKIVGAMKDFSHPGSDEKMLIDLNRAIESTVVVATNEWRYVAEMVTDFDPALPPVPCLPGELNQVILNMIINASHAIRDVVGDGGKMKGAITISTRAVGDWVETRISDTGTGIPEGIRPKIFDPFFTTKGVGRGTGQGLAIAHSVVIDKHRGEIRLESEVGKGSTFIIRLPLHPDIDARKVA